MEFVMQPAHLRQRLRVASFPCLQRTVEAAGQVPKTVPAHFAGALVGCREVNIDQVVVLNERWRDGTAMLGRSEQQCQAQQSDDKREAWGRSHGHSPGKVRSAD